MARISRKELKRDEFIEATKEAENWLEENWRLVLQILGIVAVVGLLVGGWFWYAKHNREQAVSLLDEGMQTYRTAEGGGFADTAGLESALTSFDAAAQKGGSAPVGRVADYYRGATLFRLGRYDEAIAALQRVADRAETPSLAGSASALIAEVHVARGDREQAIAVLEALVDAEPPTYPVDQALLELGELYQEAGDGERARELWQRILDEYPARGAAGEARQLLGS
jgi:tetratricopeptide (TPR) repeat protein